MHAGCLSRGSLEEQRVRVRISCTHKQCAPSPALSAQTHDSLRWSGAIYNPRESFSVVFPHSTESKKGEATRQSSTSSKGKRLMSALLLIAMSMDLELLLLKGRHRAPEYHLCPHMQQTHLQHSSAALARSGEFPQRQLLRNRRNCFLEMLRCSLTPLGRIGLLRSRSSTALMAMMDKYKVDPASLPS